MDLAFSSEEPVLRGWGIEILDHSRSAMRMDRANKGIPLLFNHDRDASFVLGRGHQQLACSACHRATVMVGGASRMIFRPLSGKCESCHIRKPGSPDGLTR